MSCEEFFIKELKRRGFRLTPQREVVLGVMHHFEKPGTVEQIFADVQKRDQQIDISTVYRTLELLQAMGVVSVIEIGEKQKLYQHVGIESPHVHLVCQKCGQVSSVDISYFADDFEILKKDKGFGVDWRNVSLPGLCQKCRENMLEDSQ